MPPERPHFLDLTIHFEVVTRKSDQLKIKTRGGLVTKRPTFPQGTGKGHTPKGCSSVKPDKKES